MSTKKAAMKTNLVRPSDEERDTPIDLDQPLGLVVAELARQLLDMQRRLTAVETAHATVARLMPRDQRPMTRQEVAAHLEDNDVSWFECIADYKNGTTKINRAKVFSSHSYRRIADHVSAGLKVVTTTSPH